MTDESVRTRLNKRLRQPNWIRREQFYLEAREIDYLLEQEVNALQLLREAVESEIAKRPSERDKVKEIKQRIKDENQHEYSLSKVDEDAARIEKLIMALQACRAENEALIVENERLKSDLVSKV